MSSKNRIFLGVAMTLLTVATAFPQYAGDYDDDDRGYAGDVQRSGYSYVREVVGGVTVESRFNGRVTARPNMPISAGDEILVSEAGRAEIGLADGNLLFVGGGSRARFSSLYAQQGEDDDFSAIDLRDGSVVLATTGADEASIPRIDTEEATVYLSAGTRVRVNADPRRGTVVVVRNGSAEVRTRVDTYTLESGQYMIVDRDGDPDIARGVFSRDRFDLWVSERMDDLYSERTRSASVEYVDDEYASEVVALDDYGDWQYSSSYSTQVWIPRVSAGWRPYTYGSWYYTPIGLTWWSYDPWGWYPFHYGSWYFDVGFRSWCWLPAYTYSPAWVYWAYTPRYVGWCPVGYYSYYSPWFDSYHRYWGWSPRYSRSASLVFAISGTFKTRDVDFGGWNFVTAGSFGSGFDRVDVVPGTRLLASLGDEIAISPKPIVVSGRGDSLVTALRDHVRKAPSVIAQSKGRDSADLAPVLGRQKNLSASTLDALKGRTVIAGRGKLAGPAADELASRGAIVEKNRSIPDFLGSRGADARSSKGGGSKSSTFERGRKAPSVGGEPRESVSQDADVWRGRGGGSEKRPKAEAAPAPEASADWRGRGGEKRGKPESAPAPEASTDWRGGDRGPEKRGKVERAPAAEAPAEWRDGGEKRGKPERAPSQPSRAPDEWRQRPQKAPKASSESRSLRAPSVSGEDRPNPGRSLSRENAWRDSGRSPKLEAAPRARGDEWRRSEAPAKRVIEGAVPGRRYDGGEAPRSRVEKSAPGTEWRQRDLPRYETRERPSVKEYRAPEAARPAPRVYRDEAREYRAPRSEPRPQPREYRPAPRVDRAPQYSAPKAPRSQPQTAPAPSGGGYGKSQGKGRKG